MTDSEEHHALTLDPEAISRLLWQFVTTRAPAVVVTPGEGSYQARFTNAGRESVSLELITAPARGALRPATVVSVSFRIDDRSGLFLTTVQRLDLSRPSPQPPLLVLAPPPQVSRGESRRSYRYPVFGDTNVRAKLMADNQTWVPKVLDLSLRGARVEFPLGRDPELEIGSAVTVELWLKNYAVRLAADVRRCDSRIYGLRFTEDLKEGALEDSTMLQTILRAVENRWLEALAQAR
jgi:PilZ domain